MVDIELPRREGSPGMTWETELFRFLDDLEGEAQAAFAVERQTEVAERARAEYAWVDLASRLMASVGDELTLSVTGLGALRGRLTRVATGWCLVEAAHQEWIVRLAAVATVRGLSPRSVPAEAWPVQARLGLGSAIRRISEVRDSCGVRLLDTSQHDVVPVRVGQDFFEALVGEQRDSTVFAFGSVAVIHTRR